MDLTVILIVVIALGLGEAALSASADLAWHMLGAALGFLALWLVARLYRSLRGRDGLGLGDAKLLAAAGTWLGPLYLAPIVFLSAVLAIAAALILRLLGRDVSFHTTLPFGPFLSVSLFGFWCLKISGWAPF